MAIGTNAQLKAAIASWTVRSNMTSRMEDIVTLAETAIRTDVRCQAMEQFTSGTLSGETLALPTRFLEARRLKVGRYVQQYVTPAEYADLDEQSSTSPCFTVIGQNFYVLNGANGDAYSLIYWQAFEPMSDEGDTTWLLTNCPDVYLYAGCFQVALVTKDQAGIEKWGGLYRDAVNRVNALESRAASSGSPLQIRSTSME